MKNKRDRYLIKLIKEASRREFKNMRRGGVIISKKYRKPKYKNKLIEFE